MFRWYIGNKSREIRTKRFFHHQLRACRTSYSKHLQLPGWPPQSLASIPRSQGSFWRSDSWHPHNTRTMYYRPVQFRRAYLTLRLSFCPLNRSRPRPRYLISFLFASRICPGYSSPHLHSWYPAELAFSVENVSLFLPSFQPHTSSCLSFNHLMLSCVPVVQDCFIPVHDESPQLRSTSPFTSWFCVWCSEQLPCGPQQERSQAVGNACLQE